MDDYVKPATVEKCLISPLRIASRRFAPLRSAAPRHAPPRAASRRSASPRSAAPRRRHASHRNAFEFKSRAYEWPNPPARSLSRPALSKLWKRSAVLADHLILMFFM
jgi:hypothetical protein